jgi:putative DNA methylase
VLGVFLKHTRQAIAELKKLNPDQPEIAEAIGAYLANVLDRLADRNSILCSWTIDYDKVRNTFARFALGMTWDYYEVNPLVETSGGYPGQLELVRSSAITPPKALANRACLACLSVPQSLSKADRTRSC